MDFTMRRNIRIIAATLLFLSSSAFICREVFSAGCAPLKKRYEFQRGMCYITWNSQRYATRESDESLKALAKTGTKWVSIVATWYQDKCYTTSIFRSGDTPTDESIIHAIDTAHSLGMKVMLKPHLDLLDTSGGVWRGEIACLTDPDWKIWFESYRDFILHYAKIAQDHKADIFCIGTELTSVATIKADMWDNVVIGPIRKVYKGPITYAANWNEEYEDIVFWDAVDYVGIDAYFPLSEKDRPSFKEIKDGWQIWLKKIEEFQAKVDKPIIFPEIGYCSGIGAARAPWEEVASGAPDLDFQADCYKAALETFWDKDWFYGMYWWRWFTYTSFSGYNKGYSPQNKPAQDVISDWYKREVPKKRY